MRICLAAFAMTLLIGSSANADVPPGPGRDFNQNLDTATNVSKEKPKKKKSHDLLIVPIPQSNPTLGSGITLVASLFYNPNKSPEPWITGVGLMRTSNKSWAIGLAHKMSLSDDRFRIVGFGGYANVDVSFFGIGPNAGDRDLSIELNEKGFAALVQGQVQVARHVFIGPRYEYLSLTSSVHRDKRLFPDSEIPRAEFKSRLSGVGAVVDYDSRDSSLNPRKGLLIAASAIYNLPAIGSDYHYGKYLLNGNLYEPVGKTTVIAARASMCSVTNGGPFYDLCLYGMNSDLRGYEAGRYRNNAYWAAQVELRQRLFGRFGAVVFGGVGESTDRIGDFGNGKRLPSAGVGLRYQPSKSTPVNLRVDYARGKDSHALYIGVGEAF